MPKFAPMLAAFVALLAGVAGRVEASVCFQRTALAYLLGWLSYQVWNAFVSGVSGSFVVTSTVTNDKEANKASEAEQKAA